jgi:4-hydroxymandelate oxidase
LKLLPRVLKAARNPDTYLELFGRKLSNPIFIAPIAYHRAIHPDGELATMKGAAEADSLYVVSSFTTTPLEDIAKNAQTNLWFQLYVTDDRSFTRELVQKAEDLGFEAICVTVDTPVVGTRNRQKRSGFVIPENLHAPYMIDATSSSVINTYSQQNPVTWKDIAWLKSFMKVPLLLKGILHPDDALMGIDHGASGIIVSNHGGRNLDTVPASIEILPYITERVNHRVPVLMDGGICRGTDVIKALALGARAVLVGKPICYGLAMAGHTGVCKVLQILQKEFETAMTLCGVSSLAEIDQNLIWKINR